MKITKAKLHNNVFLDGLNLSGELSSAPGAKQVSMTMEGNFLKVSRGTKCILVPFTNIIQIEADIVPEAPAAAKSTK